jgi:hypothetical protein
VVATTPLMTIDEDVPSANEALATGITHKRHSSALSAFAFSLHIEGSCLQKDCLQK